MHICFQQRGRAWKRTRFICFRILPKVLTNADLIFPGMQVNLRGCQELLLCGRPANLWTMRWSHRWRVKIKSQGLQRNKQRKENKYLEKEDVDHYLTNKMHALSLLSQKQKKRPFNRVHPSKELKLLSKYCYFQNAYKYSE